MSRVEEFVDHNWHFIKREGTYCYVSYEHDVTYLKTELGLESFDYQNTRPEADLYKMEEVTRALKSSGIKLGKGDSITVNKNFAEVCMGIGIPLGNYMRDEYSAIEIIEQILELDDVVALVWSNGKERIWIARYSDGWALEPEVKITWWDAVIKWWRTK